MNLLEAIDEVLWLAVGAIETSYLVGNRGGHNHTQEALRCYLAIFARLDIRTRLESDPAIEKSKVFPALGLTGGSKHENARQNYELLCGFDPDASWRPNGAAGAPSIWEAMCAALSVSPKGAIDKFWRLAPALLAAQLMRGEVDLYLPLTDAVTPTLRAIETRLDERGLLPAYAGTRIVRDALDTFAALLEKPLHGFTKSVHDFEFALKQLDTVYHSLKAVMIYEDSKVGQIDAYFKRQLDLLERGITIERVFLYEEATEEEVRALEDKQRTLACRAIDSRNNGGSYITYLVSSVIVEAMPDVEPLPSFVIMDHGEPTQRVVRWTFEALEQYAMSASTADIRRYAELFGILKDHADRD